MLLRHIGLGAMRRDAHRAHAKIIGALEIMDGADAGEQQGGEHAMLKHLGDRADPVPVGVRPEPIVEARSLQAVAMRDLDRIDLRLIERPGARLTITEALLGAYRWTPVAQRPKPDDRF